MDLDIAGRVAIVTGSTAGIGFATGRALAREGATTVVNGRTADRVAKAVETIVSEVPGASVRGVAADLSTAEGCAALGAEVPQADILVNNVGIFDPKAFEEIPDDDWLRFFETNVMSGVRLTRRFLPGMKDRNWGRVVFVSSESAVHIPAEMIHYGVTKTAQVAVARGVAETTAGTGVTVNSVLVGPTRSEGVAAFVDRLARGRGLDPEAMEREFFSTARPTSLLQRFLSIDEAANLIVYLCSAAASGTNGSALRVDGGVIKAAL